jgi:hypothetical protein
MQDQPLEKKTEREVAHGWTWTKINKLLNHEWHHSHSHNLDDFDKHVVLPLMKKVFQTDEIQTEYFVQGSTGYDLWVKDEVFTFW